MTGETFESPSAGWKVIRNVRSMSVEGEIAVRYRKNVFRSQKKLSTRFHEWISILNGAPCAGSELRCWKIRQNGRSRINTAFLLVRHEAQSPKVCDDSSKKNSAFFPFMNIHLAVKAFRGSLFKKQTTRIGGFCLGNRLVPSHLRIGFICERNFHPGRHQQKKSRKGKATYNFSVTPLTSSGCLSQAMDFLCCHCVAKNVSCCEVSSHSRSHLLLSQRNFLSFSCENEPTSAFASLEVLFLWCKDLHYPSAFDLNRFQYQPAS